MLTLLLFLAITITVIVVGSIIAILKIVFDWVLFPVIVFVVFLLFMFIGIII